MCHLILFLPVFSLPIFWLFPLSTALPLYLFILGLTFLLYFKIFQAMRRQVLTGKEAMMGKKGLVLEDVDPEGKVLCASEIWDAVSTSGSLPKGHEVKIKGIRGLTLLVEGLREQRNGIG
ncbi:MAG: hypothetical protein JRJ29_22300 [Deltaproteobacteria bacterium]|nr:hypothetical protein [Deltaproteobacteria bacterium]